MLPLTLLLTLALMLTLTLTPTARTPALHVEQANIIISIVSVQSVANGGARTCQLVDYMRSFHFLILSKTEFCN